ncbi:2OG-Fe(II) oxygenase [Paraburkholderia caballeronis]|uniref:2OG-Fe(II) oxygenase n=1 Tax=Paraburkholderia caballeronis TaxID=416943 RepID=UPI001066FB7D|nr:2OG-Fe(II) oxygenase [Paraburkholderia caballeronis]TDV14415.1 Rps23 Pro-64 3,4-dihydroxylase Tpa1-like proline 4-hydroxylase [Paraburkholderia caballeronis]TDV15941.1 Rps23 Pro-64 3,4-dihydroxylase Tpa1-like proline 4-hydroxylase [Paraburkholderia caballeronis]TDV25202.1 Rps23 Pro-64 3,4-dihydroxylase Tpa1-like proline 4-hydroxylase [Paraburkholderia caballeronis]
MDRNVFGALIARRLEAEFARLREQWASTAPIPYFFVDDLLPDDLAMEIRAAFPDPAQMMLRRSLRELKYVSAQMNAHAPILEEIIFGFQMPEVVERVKEATGLRSLYPDEHLYAGGISMMGPGHFLNPHLDNSHDKDRARYRVLNLLYYVSPGWRLENGANLEVWPDGTKAEPATIVSRFNRLAVMVTNQHSWHSVSKNVSGEARCCVSNYYFSDHPAGDDDYFHPTSFRGRPEQPVRDVVLQADAAARAVVRRVFPKGMKVTTHVYRKR